MTIGLSFWLTHNRILVPKGESMGQVVFVLLVLGGLGYYFYRQMSGEAAQNDSGWAQAGGSEAEAESDPQKNTQPSQAETLDVRIVSMVSRSPGILQTDVYEHFPEENRKNLQAVLLQMDRDGALRREREGATYRLFVA
jgi:hypothetical protein